MERYEKRLVRTPTVDRWRLKIEPIKKHLLISGESLEDKAGLTHQKLSDVAVFSVWCFQKAFFRQSV